MNFEECYMDRFVQRVVHGTCVSDVLNDFGKDLLDRLKQETEGGHLSKSNQECVRLFMEKLERTLWARAGAPVDTGAHGHMANGKSNCTINGGYHGCTFNGDVYGDNNCAPGAVGVNPHEVREIAFGEMPREVR